MTAEINGFNSPRPSGIYRNAMEKRIENLEAVVDTLCTQVSALTMIVETSTPAIPATTPTERPKGIHKVGQRSIIDYGDK